MTGQTPSGLPADTKVVALVGSAGGLEQLLEVLSMLPAECPAAIVVLLHHNPTTPSVLPKLLARRCALPATLATQGQKLEPGTIVVAPPGKHLLITVEGRVALIDSDGTPPYRPSADLLLTSLALVAGPRTIVVILSGLGRDGATGATAVHDFGGCVIAVEPETSAHPDMPREAIARDEVVDHVVAPGKIASLLEELLS
jgi:two-component system chemotaxis response regulator CheB